MCLVYIIMSWKEQFCSQFIEWQPLVTLVSGTRLVSLLFLEYVFQAFSKWINLIYNRFKNVHHQLLIQQPSTSICNFSNGLPSNQLFALYPKLHIEIRQAPEFCLRAILLECILPRAILQALKTTLSLPLVEEL